MTKSFATLAATLLAGSLFAVTAFADAPKMAPKPMKKMAAATCPFCKMPLATKPSKAMPIAIMMHGKKYYTCAPCKAKVAAMMMHKPMKTM